jgi:hypothetical protein
MGPLESSVNDTTIWSVTLESSVMSLEVSFDVRNMEGTLIEGEGSVQLTS